MSILQFTILTAYDPKLIWWFSSATWVTVMYVHPHRLQEVLKNLLWSSWYHSVPAKVTKDHIKTQTFLIK